MGKNSAKNVLAGPAPDAWLFPDEPVVNPGQFRVTQPHRNPVSKLALWSLVPLKVIEVCGPTMCWTDHQPTVLRVETFRTLLVLSLLARRAVLFFPFFFAFILPS